MRLLSKLLTLVSAMVMIAACSSPASSTSLEVATSPLGEGTAASTPCVYGQVKASRDSGIYQVPSGRFYSWTTADMICFDTAALALQAGFRPSER
jgi:hypothetical protein